VRRRRFGDPRRGKHVFKDIVRIAICNVHDPQHFQHVNAPLASLVV
jgi:hypothetical protein